MRLPPMELARGFASLSSYIARQRIPRVMKSLLLQKAALPERVGFR